MKREAIRGIGLILLVIGFIIVINSLQKFTGFIILEDVNIYSGYYVGFWFVLAGIALVLVASSPIVEQVRNKEGALLTVVRTHRFDKAIRGQDPGQIQNTLQKLGTGLAHEERLHYLEGYSIRASKGARIIYDKTPGGKIVLKDFTPDHKYR